MKNIVEDGGHLRYSTSRDGPDGRAVSLLLTDVFDWVGETFAEDRTYRRKRCRAIIADRRIALGGLSRFDTNVEVHGSHLACDHSRRHGAHAITKLSLEYNAFYTVATISSVLMAESGDTLCAHNEGKFATETLSDGQGLTIENISTWDNTFANVEELGEYLETLRTLAIGKISMRDGYSYLIAEPALNQHGYALPDFPLGMHAPNVGTAQT